MRNEVILSYESRHYRCRIIRVQKNYRPFYECYSTTDPFSMMFNSSAVRLKGCRYLPHAFKFVLERASASDVLKVQALYERWKSKRRKKRK